MKIIRTLACTLCTLAAAIAQAQTISDDVVKIGVLTDLSGVYSDIGGKGSVIAAKMAIKDFNKNGTVLGKRIEITVADHQNKADIASATAREWYDQGKVDVIVDLSNSTAALAVMSVAEQKKKLTLISGAASLAITNERCNAYNVQWVTDFYPMTNTLPKQMVQAGKKKWFFITVDNAAGHFLEEKTIAAVKAAGGEVVGSARHPLASSDFSSYLVRAQSSKADVIALANTGGDAINSVKTASEFGITKGTQVLVPLYIYISEVHTLGLDKMQGVNLVEPFYWNQSELARTWSRRFFEESKRMPSSLQAGVYSSVLSYLKAVEATKSDAPEGIMKYLTTTGVNDGLFNGKVRADGRLLHEMVLVEVKKPSESTTPWDYYKIKTVMSGDASAQPLSDSKCNLIKK